jgi:transcriptional regulator of acetoin/glycerol metabolism
LQFAGIDAEARRRAARSHAMQRAGELVGIHRPTLYAKLKRFGIAL